MKNNTLLTLEETLSAVNGRLVCGGNPCDFAFNAVCTDSRNATQKSLFVPLVGENQDGHLYIKQAVQNGASVIFINESEYQKNTALYDSPLEYLKDIFVIAVQNTMYALQNAAAAYVQKFPALKKIAITGSSGKTTTKELIVSVLKQKYNVVYTQGNFNSETGLPLSVFNIRPEHEVGVFEMGMNRFNEIKEISSVLKASYGVITNIGSAHIGILKTRQNIAQEKRAAFDYITSDGAAFIPAEDDFAEFLSENVRGKVVLYGLSVPKEKSGAEFISDDGLFGSTFLLDNTKITLNLPGAYNYKNALAACAVAKEFGLSSSQIKAGIEAVHPVAGRMEAVKAELKNGAKIALVKDFYNANPESMGGAIELCSQSKKQGRLIFVLGDMRELGEHSEEEHIQIAKKVVNSLADFIIFAGKNMEAAYKYAVQNGFKNAFHFDFETEKSVASAAEKLLLFCQTQDTLLLKGSRGMALERLLPLICKDASL